MTRFEGRVAVVTGGATGMGKVHVEHLASQGASIAIGDLSATADAERAVRAQRQTAFGHVLDVTSEESVNTFSEAVMARFKRATSWSTMPASTPSSLSTK